MFCGSGQPSARWQAHSALATKLTNQSIAISSIGRAFAEFVAPQTESSARSAIRARPGRRHRGALPALATNSKSCSQISSNGSSVGVTSGPLFEKRMLGAVDQPALVAKCQLEDLGRLQVRPLRIAKPAGGRGKHLVTTVFLVGEQPHPFVEALDQTDFLGAVIFILLAVSRWPAERARCGLHPVEVIVRYRAWSVTVMPMPPRFATMSVVTAK